MLRSNEGVWATNSEYQQVCPGLSKDKFLQVTNLLLEQPNLNSTHLFRADILFDSTGELKTPAEKTRNILYAHPDLIKADDIERDTQETLHPPSHHQEEVKPTIEIEDATLQRQVLRRLVPRKPQLDRALEQWCYIYDLTRSPGTTGHIVVYMPQVRDEQDMPWYHPPVRALAYVYEIDGSEATLSVHFLPYRTPSASNPLPTRLHRTFISLLQTFLRLAKSSAPTQKATQADSSGKAELSMAPSALKDTILAQHVVQDTYSRLKQQYAADLISRWVEKTEPSKHVFEDLSIAAFVIELWKQMYNGPSDFPGFVDIACGNGVLSYILIQEGYRGRGFDARRRNTWAVLGMEEHLDEMICVPRPLLDTLGSETTDLLPGAAIHDGIFKAGTFIISNHVDELTPWTPLLAALASPASPLPFLAIPCCSHTLSGAKHRYSPRDVLPHSAPSALNDTESQPATGDLKALREAKVRASSQADNKSMYACLTRKIVSIAEEVGFDVELTLMRIPSTRNIGVVGNRRKALRQQAGTDSSADHNDIAFQVQTVVERECSISGGVRDSAKTWVERGQKLQTGKGRGKVNLGGKRDG